MGPYDATHRGLSLIRNSALLGPYSRPSYVPMVVLGGGLFLMSEVHLQDKNMKDGNRGAEPERENAVAVQHRGRRPDNLPP